MFFGRGSKDYKPRSIFMPLPDDDETLKNRNWHVATCGSCGAELHGSRRCRCEDNDHSWWDKVDDDPKKTVRGPWS